MKNISIILPIVLIVFFTGCQKSETPVRSNRDSNRINSIQIHLAGYNFPLTVNQVVKDNGLPADTYIDDNRTCPFGQLHSWYFKDNNYALIVLGDNYEKKAEYSAESRLIGIKKLNQEAAARFEGILNVLLDDTESDVKGKLESFVAKNQSFSISENTTGSPLQRFFCPPPQFKKQFILDDGKTYIYFLINKANRLEAIIKSSMNFLDAC